MSNFKDIPHIAFEEIYNFLDEKTRDNLIKYILTDCNDPKSCVIDYIKNIINEVFFLNGEGLGIGSTGEIRNSFYRKIRTTKKNWYKQLKKDVENRSFTPIHNERDMLEKFLGSKFADENMVKSLENIKDKDQFVNSRLQEVEEWANDSKSLITDFIYLDSKKEYQIERAFHNDIVFTICEYFKNAPRNFISHVFKDIVDNPIFADSRTKAEGEIVVDEVNNTKVLINEYKLDSDRTLRSIISAKDDEGIELSRTYLLDDIDQEIFQFAMENRDDEQFYNENKIVFDIRPLLLRIYGNTGKKSYESAVKRLKKIGAVRFEGRKIGPNNEVTSDFLYNLFQHVEVKKDEGTGRVYAEISLSNALHEEYVAKKTYKLYTPLVNRLENKLAKMLFQSFQKERIQAYLDGREIKTYYSYSFFTRRIRFRTKLIQSTLEKIEEALQSLKDANIFLKSFERKGRGFEIILSPLSQTEIADFFTREETNNFLSD